MPFFKNEIFALFNEKKSKLNMVIINFFVKASIQILGAVGTLIIHHFAFKFLLKAIL